MTDLRIEELSVADASRVRALYVAAASVAGSGLARAPDEIGADYVEGFLRRACGNGVTLGAFLGDRLVGELHAARPGPRQFDHVLTDLTIAVDPAAQGKGIGSALFAAFFERTAMLVPGVSRVELIARSGNLGALKLYRRLRFVEEGRLVGRVRLPDGRTEDDICMARFL